MRLSEMLIYADIEQLSEIAKRYQCQCSSHSKHELIQSIISHSYREDIMFNHLINMPDEQKHLISLVLFDVNKKYSTEELKAKIKYCNFKLETVSKPKSKKLAAVKTISTEEEMIKQLKYEGWLFKEQSFLQHLIYQIPEDKQALFRSVVTDHMNSQLTTYNVNTIVRDESGYWEEDTKLLLNFLNKTVVPLNEINLMNKRTAQQILTYFNVNETIPGKNAWKFGYGKKFGEYPDRFALLYQFCVSSGCIIEDGIITISDKGQSIMNNQTNIDYVKLIEYWLLIYKKPIPNIKSITYFLLCMLNEWRAVDEIQNQLRPYIKAYYFDNEDAILHKRILKMLLHFGVIILGHDEAQTLVVRLTPYGRQWLMQALKIDEQGRYLPNS